MKSESEVWELRDRLASLTTSGKYHSGSTKWQKIEAAEATLDWTLGSLDGFPEVVRQLEEGGAGERECPPETDGFGRPKRSEIRYCPYCGARASLRESGVYAECHATGQDFLLE